MSSETIDLVTCMPQGQHSLSLPVYDVNRFTVSLQQLSSDMSELSQVPMIEGHTCCGLAC